MEESKGVKGVKEKMKELKESVTDSLFFLSLPEAVICVAIIQLRKYLEMFSSTSLLGFE